MAIAVKLDFNHRYAITPVTDDLRISTFQTELQDGSRIPLKVEISSEPHELIPTVFNLAFGPINDRGEIDDRAEIAHKDYSIFTIVFCKGTSTIWTGFLECSDSMRITSDLMYNYFIFNLQEPNN